MHRDPDLWLAGSMVCLRPGGYLLCLSLIAVFLVKSLGVRKKNFGTRRAGLARQIWHEGSRDVRIFIQSRYTRVWSWDIASENIRHVLGERKV